MSYLIMNQLLEQTQGNSSAKVISTPLFLTILKTLDQTTVTHFKFPH